MAQASMKHLFVSYARQDAPDVLRFLEPFRAELKARQLPVDVWRDQDYLQPGSSWEHTIREAIDNSVGLLVFVSESSMQSAWVRQELQAVMASTDRLVIPVILQHVSNLPDQLTRFQWLDISNDLHSKSDLASHAGHLADAIAKALPAYSNHAPLSPKEAERLAEITTNDARKSVAPPSAEQSSPPTSVFLVHGHDTASRDIVCAALRDIGVEPVVLSQSLGQSQSLLQKFLGVSTPARFAVVLLTADDYGASLLQFDKPGVADKALQFRARQNVVLELGFFYGHLGWENVFV